MNRHIYILCSECGREYRFSRKKKKHACKRSHLRQREKNHQIHHTLEYHVCASLDDNEADDEEKEDEMVSEYYGDIIDVNSDKNS